MKRITFATINQINLTHSLELPVLVLDLLAGDWVSLDMLVLRVDDKSTNLAELTLPADSEERCVEVGVVLSEILLLLTPDSEKTIWKSIFVLDFSVGANQIVIVNTT